MISRVTLAVLAALMVTLFCLDPPRPPRLPPSPGGRRSRTRTAWWRTPATCRGSLFGLQGRGARGRPTPYGRVGVPGHRARPRVGLPISSSSSVVRWLSPNEYIEYNHLHTPFVMKDRDFVSKVTLSMAPSTHQFTIAYGATQDDAGAPRTDYVRGEIKNSRFILTPVDGGKRTHLVAEVHCDPMGSVPKWLVNFFQRSWPIDTFYGLRRQVAKPDLKEPPRTSRPSSNDARTVSLTSKALCRRQLYEPRSPCASPSRTTSITDAIEEASSTPRAIAAVMRVLEKAGHQVDRIDVTGPASRLVARLEAFAPDLIFNVAEGHRGRMRRGFYPALFEELGMPATGSDAYALCVTLDKALTKKLLAGFGIPSPRGRLLTRESLRAGGLDELPYPVIAKPNFEGSSKGITQQSVADDAVELGRLLDELLSAYPEGVLVERYIPGVDIRVCHIDGLPRLPAIEPLRRPELRSSVRHPRLCPQARGFRAHLLRHPAAAQPARGRAGRRARRARVRRARSERRLLDRLSCRPRRGRVLPQRERTSELRA